MDKRSESPNTVNQRNRPSGSVGSSTLHADKKSGDAEEIGEENVDEALSESSMVEALNEKMDFIFVKLNKPEEIDAKLDDVIKNIKSLEVKSLNVEFQKTKDTKAMQESKTNNIEQSAQTTVEDTQNVPLGFLQNTKPRNEYSIHCLGKKKDRSRMKIANFLRYGDRGRILREAFKLKDSKFSRSRTFGHK